MPSLYDVQQDFAQFLISGDTASMTSHVSGGEGAAKYKRLAVYRNNVVSSLTVALGDNFPVVKQLVGEGFFAFAAHEFITANPLNSPALSVFGKEFPTFLADFEPASGHPYLPDVARLELDWLAAFHAADAEPLSAQSFAGIEPEQLADLRLNLHPSARLLSSDYPVADIWDAVQSGGQDLGQVPMEDSGCFVLSIRPRSDVELRKLSPAGYALIMALHKGETLASAFENALERDPAFDLQRHVQDFLAGETFSAYDLP